MGDGVWKLFDNIFEKCMVLKKLNSELDQNIRFKIQSRIQFRSATPDGDLLYPESLRNIPLALHMERIGNEESGHQRLLTLPPQQFKSGSIIQVVSLDEAGQYVLTLEGIDSEINQQFTVQIPIKVGTSWLDTVVKFWPLFI